MMIEFYRPETCAQCDTVEANLAEMVIAHKVVVVTPEQPRPAWMKDISPPVLKDKDEVVVGLTAIKTHLTALEQFVHDWRRFQGDSCYCDE